MSKGIGGRRLRRRALAAAACLLAAAAATAIAGGCGGAQDDGGPPPRTVVRVESVRRDRWTYARERFTEMCAGCHTLADAGARGRRFNLDHAGDIDEARARFAIAKGEPGMPAWEHVLSRRELEELVAYVSSVDRHAPGNDGWHWQMALRQAGERWRPEDGSSAPDGTERAGPDATEEAVR